MGPQNNVSTIVAGGGDDGYDSLFCDGEEMMAMGRGLDRINGNSQRPIRAVLETYWEGQSTGQFSV